MNKYWSLTNINVYKILCPPKLNKLDKQIGRCYFKEDVIYDENQIDRKIYLVSNGKVKLVNYDNNGNEIVRQILTKGELFGENLILGDEVRNEFAVSCDNKTAVCSLDIETMKRLMREDERFSTAIYKFIGFKLKKIERRLDLLVGKDITTRVASFLYDEFKEQQKNNFSNLFSHKEIASLLATSRESVSKIFNSLKEQGIIDYNRKSITVINVPALKKMAQ